MPDLDLQALRFWNAALFHRQAPERNQSIADRLIREAAQSTHPSIRQRAEEILKEKAA